MKPLRPDLPESFIRVAPALAMVAMPEEHRATCASCAMAPRDEAHANHQRTFTAAERCCTYNPFLPNFMVGRILRRGDEGARAMLARLRTTDDGVSAAGVGPDAAANGYYTENLDQFGVSRTTVAPTGAAGRTPAPSGVIATRSVELGIASTSTPRRECSGGVICGRPYPR